VKGKISQNVMTSRMKFEKEKNYWLGKLSGDLVISRFPHLNVKEENNAVEQKRENYEFNFPGWLGSKMGQMANQSEFGVFMMLTTAINFLLFRYTGYHDIIIGTPVFLSEEPVVDHYVNHILVLRNCVKGEMTFREFLLLVRETIMEANEHMNFPYYKLLKLLKVPKTSRLSDLFETMVVYNPIQIEEIVKQEPCEIRFLFRKKNEEIECCIDYNSYHFTRQFIVILSQYIIRYFEEVTQNTNILLAQVDVIPLQEREKILEEFNGPCSPYPAESTVDDLFDQQVNRTPGRTAVIYKKEGLTYKELRDKSEKLMTYLKMKGVKKGDIIGHIGRRSQGYLIGILGIFKAGAACLPINLEYPGKRIEALLRDSDASFLLKQARDEYFFDFQGEIINIEQGIVSETYTKKDSTAKRKDGLAYLIYTSGSTGTPKGVMLVHRGIANHLYTKIDQLKMNEDDICCQNLSVGFVASIWQFFAPVIIGARLHIYPPELVYGSYELFKQVASDGVTIVEVVPAILNSFLEIPKEDTIHIDLTRIRCVVLTGEEVLPPLVNKFYQRYNIQLINAYGQSECSDDTLQYKIPKATPIIQVPIGKPSKNTQLYILHSDNTMLQPIGIPGEMLVSGDGLSPGYLNDPGLTGEKFLPHPFKTGERIFRTGDITRWLPTGEVGFLGRKDLQVKIRGVRIELGEIESTIMKYESVQDSVVIAWEDKQNNDSNDRFLCAYVVSQEEISFSGLKEYLSRVFPSYMIPSRFKQLEKLPLTPSGKVDRNALPVMETRKIEEQIVPRDMIEKQLAEVWSEVLGKDPDSIGIDDNFFDSGGHSLKANILILKIHKKFNIKIPLAEVFMDPTLRGLLRHIKKAVTHKHSSIEVSEKKEYYGLSSAQKRMYVLQLLELGSTGYHLSRVLLLEKGLNLDELEKILEQVIQRHESLRTTFQLINEEPVQKVHDHVEFKIEMLEKEDFLGITNSKENVLQVDDIVEYFQRPLNLNKAPLLRVGFTIWNSYRDLLVFDLHHIIADGLSLDLLAMEFLKLKSGEELSRLRIQYRDFAEWQNSEIQQQLKKQQESYWIGLYPEELPVLELPTDFPRPVTHDFKGGAINFALTRNDTTLIKEFVRQTDTTLYMSLLAIFNLMLFSLTGQEDIIVGTPVTLRPQQTLNGSLEFL
jgi:amino acid adenylation domain-containing protein